MKDVVVIILGIFVMMMMTKMTFVLYIIPMLVIYHDEFFESLFKACSLDQRIAKFDVLLPFVIVTYIYAK